MGGHGKTVCVRSLAILAFSLGLVGCTIAPREASTPKPVEPSRVENLDRSNVHLAEVTVPMDQLGAKLRIIARFDKHNEWTDAYIKETLTAASFLKQNDRLEGQMLATLDNESAIIEVAIIRADADRYGVRVQCSQKKMTDAIQTALEKG